MFTKLIKNPELQGTVIIAVGTTLGSFFAYLLQFFLGRILSIEDYGSFNALISLLTMVSVPIGVFTVVLVKIVAGLFAQKDFRRITALFWQVSFFSLVYALSMFCIVTLLSGLITTTFKIYNIPAILFFGLYLGISMFPTLIRSYLQALLRYRSLAFYTVFSGFLRFIFPVAFVFFGFKLGGVFLGMSIGMLLSYLLSLPLLKKNFQSGEKISLKEQYKQFLHLGIPVALINLGLMSLNNIDMLLVKKLFDPTLAGYYAGTVTLGKILLFGAGSVTVIMFPQVSGAHSRGENYIKGFTRLLFLQIALVILGTAFFIIFPGFLTQVFFGARFANSIQYLPGFSVFIGLYILVSFMVMFFLAIDKKKVFLCLLPGAVAQYILITLFHKSLDQIIQVNMAVMSFTCLIFGIYLVRTLSKERLQYNE
jgi:O-antigen/teichoic acid export membrane protein